jgi:hypothetical protein
MLVSLGHNRLRDYVDIDAGIACMQEYRAGKVQRGGTVVFFLPDREGAFLLSSLVQSKVGGLGVLGSQGGGVGAKWESREGLGNAVALIIERW